MTDDHGRFPALEVHLSSSVSRLPETQTAVGGAMVTVAVLLTTAEGGSVPVVSLMLIGLLSMLFGFSGYASMRKGRMGEDTST